MNDKIGCPAILLNGHSAKLYVNGTFKAQYSYSATFSGGKVGFRAVNANTTFDNFMVSTAEISRTTYTLAGRTIATRVTGDPTATNNGLFYIFSDHLGSTSVLAYGDGGQIGAEVPGSRARYYPFGGPRTAPTQTITDRNFTGQKENMELGLIYYNARYYVPTIGRFASADTIVPDPANPQQFNRYAYTLNNPLKFTDPSGHCGGDPNNNNPLDGNGNVYTDCTAENFDAMTIEQRLIWVRAFAILSGAGDWFNNIIGILEAFRDSGYGTTGSWISVVDSHILHGIQDGYVGRASSNSGATIWSQFFSLLKSHPSELSLRSLWGQAEQAATEHGVEMANQQGLIPSLQEQFFLAIGNAYRSAVSNPGSFGQLVSNGLTNAGYCGWLLTTICTMSIQLSVDATLSQGHINSYAFTYWYTDPRSMINGHSVMYWSAMLIFQSQLPTMPYVFPGGVLWWPQ